jgi:hypothetical protein
MADSTLAALTAATAGTGGLYYGTQSGADRKFTVTAAGATLAEAADAAAQRTALGVLALTGGTLTGPLTITGGTVTTSTPLLIQTQTWNGGTQAFKANTLNITNTASKAYSATWADVSTAFEYQIGGTAKLAFIPVGSENLPMLRLGSGTDGSHALLKAGTSALITRLSDGIDMVSMGFHATQFGITVADNFAGGTYKGVIGFNSTSNVMGGGNGSADAMFSRLAAASIQMGLSSATPINQLFTGPSGVGTNIVGGKLSIGPGKSTGNATPATVVLQGTAAGSSGTTAQTLVDVLTVVRAGVVRITNIPTSSAGLSTGDIYSNLGILTIV